MACMCGVNTTPNNARNEHGSERAGKKARVRSVPLREPARWSAARMGDAGQMVIDGAVFFCYSFSRSFLPWPRVRGAACRLKKSLLLVRYDLRVRHSSIF